MSEPGGVSGGADFSALFQEISNELSKNVDFQAIQEQTGLDLNQLGSLAPSGTGEITKATLKAFSMQANVPQLPQPSQVGKEIWVKYQATLETILASVLEEAIKQRAPEEVAVEGQQAQNKGDSVLAHQASTTLQNLRTTPNGEELPKLQGNEAPEKVADHQASGEAVGQLGDMGMQHVGQLLLGMSGSQKSEFIQSVVNALEGALHSIQSESSEQVERFKNSAV